MPPPLPAPTPRPVSIRAWRCARHPEREAAARCPVCGQPFCRECVVEHEGRLLCTACLAKLNRPAATRPPRDFARMRARLVLAAAVATLWSVFFFAGELLARIPQNFHDATFWQELDAPPPSPHHRTAKP